jgi:hypothetical protein
MWSISDSPPPSWYEPPDDIEEDEPMTTIYRLAEGQGYALALLQTAPQATPFMRIPWASRVINGPLKRSDAARTLWQARRLGRIESITRT